MSRWPAASSFITAVIRVTGRVTPKPMAVTPPMIRASTTPPTVQTVMVKKLSLSRRR